MVEYEVDEQAIVELFARREEMDSFEFIKAHWRLYQCPACRAGDRSQCQATREDSRADMTAPDGTKKYYCFIGCALLDILDNSDNEKATLDKLVREGRVA